MTERRILSKEEQNIRKGIQELSNMVLKTIDDLHRALTGLDTSLCASIIANDKNINAQQAKIEQDCISTIATQQPVATDLRVLISALCLSVELERIADHLAGIADTIVKISEYEPVDSVSQVLAMAEKCGEMLGEAMQAYNTYDSERARTIAAKDREIDEMQDQLSNDIIQQMCNETNRVPFGSRLLWIVHSLERIGDRTTNICEQIVYISQGAFPDLNR